MSRSKQIRPKILKIVQNTKKTQRKVKRMTVGAATECELKFVPEANLSNAKEKFA